jgi:hypothetical protein
MKTISAFLIYLVLVTQLIGLEPEYPRVAFFGVAAATALLIAICIRWGE